jgi:deazaflavin-dependent oxidoreductase (nitroreductase family)
MPLPRALARFNRRVSNKILGPLAHVAPPFALVEHRGRRSGRHYSTPVWAFRTDRGFVVALTYGGSRTEWVKNVLADGRAKLVIRRRSYEVNHPRVAHGSDGMRAVPAIIRPALRALGVDDYLLLDHAEGADKRALVGRHYGRGNARGPVREER